MRKYIFRFLGFALIALAIFGGWTGVLVWLEVSAHAREVKMSPGTIYAVCGDSQTEVALRANLWPHFFNFSKSAIKLDQLELKVVDLLEHNPGMPKYLLIDVSPRKLAVQSIDAPLCEARSAGKRLMLHLLYPQKSRRSLNGIVFLFRDAILLKQTTRAFRSIVGGKRYSSSIGGPGGAGPDLTEEDVAENRRRYLVKAAKMGFDSHRDLVLDSVDEHSAELNFWGPTAKSAKSVGCIRDIVAYVKDKGVTPILMTTPLHPIFWSKVPKAQFDNFREIMEWLSSSCGVVWLDYLTMPFPDEEWRDANHLNLHGAVRFTDRVRADVERLAARKGTR